MLTKERIGTIETIMLEYSKKVKCPVCKGPVYIGGHRWVCYSCTEIFEDREVLREMNKERLEAIVKEMLAEPEKFKKDSVSYMHEILPYVVLPKDKEKPVEKVAPPKPAPKPKKVAKAPVKKAKKK